MNSSWKTSLCGAITLLGTFLIHTNDPTLYQIGQVLVPLGTAAGFFFARDNNKTSEQVGAGTTSVSPGRGLNLLFCLLALGLLVSCARDAQLSFWSKVKSDAAQAESWIASPAGQSASRELQTIGNVLISMYGGKSAQAESAALQGVNLFVGTVTKGEAPSADSIQSVLTDLGTKQKTAAIISPVASSIIQQAVASGLNHNAATTAAQNLVQSLGSTLSSSQQP